MNPIHKRLTTDYTLFNLNDPATTRFYIRNIDYLIDNFPYFKDIALVTEYLTAGNPRFTAKFRARLPRFLDVVRYDCFGDPGPEAPAAVESPSEGTVKCLYPSDESSREDPEFEEYSSEAASENSPAIDSLQHLNIASSTKGPPVGDAFTNNPTHLVMNHFSRVLVVHIGCFPITDKFTRFIISRLEYDAIHNLLVSLLQEGAILPILLKNDCVRLIMDKNLKSLCALLEGVLYSSRNNIEDEEDFVDQVEVHKDALSGRFLQIGEALSLIDRTDASRQEDSAADDISDAVRSSPLKYKVEFSTIYKILHAICQHRSSINISPVRVRSVNRFSLYYIRLLSYNPTFADADLAASLIHVFFENPQCSHLHSSVLRILVKVPAPVLKSVGFFERMYSVCYDHISATRASPQGPEGAGRTSSLFSFLIRLYIRYASFIKAEYPGWDVFHSLMEASCRLERTKYKPEDLDKLCEYEGFQRYVVESMLGVLPYPSVFTDQPIN